MLIQHSVDSDWLFNTQSRVLQADWFILEINEMATLNIRIPYSVLVIFWKILICRFPILTFYDWLTGMITAELFSSLITAIGSFDISYSPNLNTCSWSRSPLGNITFHSLNLLGLDFTGWILQLFILSQLNAHDCTIAFWVYRLFLELCY